MDELLSNHNLYYLKLPHGGNRSITLEEFHELNLNSENRLPELNGKKTWVSNYVGTFWSHIMKPDAFAIYFQLMKLCYGDKDYAFPSVSYLAMLTGMSPRSVQRHLLTLCELNFVIIVEVKQARNLENLPNIYLLSNTIPFISKTQYEALPKRLQKEHDEFMEYIKRKKLLKDSETPFFE